MQVSFNTNNNLPHRSTEFLKVHSFVSSDGCPKLGNHYTVNNTELTLLHILPHKVQQSFIFLYRYVSLNIVAGEDAEGHFLHTVLRK